LSLRTRCASAVRVRNVSSDSLAKAARLSDGFLQYAISPHNTLTTKLTRLRWRECSICEELVNGRLPACRVKACPARQHDVSANASDQLHVEGVHLVTPSIGIPCLRRRVGVRVWEQA
jgi:hypothetical protein